MNQEPQLNSHNKAEYPPMHTAELETSPIVIYTTEDNQVSLDVRLDGDTMWLNRHQLSILFDRDIKTIGKHINNALKEELDGLPVIANFATTATDGKTYMVDHYNLEMIASVGYRVKSKRGVQFRRWANRILKDYIIKGYTINEKIKLEHYAELKSVVRLLSTTVKAQEKLTTDESDGLFSVIADYVYALDTLDKYDFQQLIVDNTIKEERFHATYENAMDAINRLKPKFGGSALFANEKDDSFRSSIGQIYQTWDGEELYPSIEEKAAMLLYLVVKNHSFSDGNKRIAAMLFLWFMERNGILYREDGEKRIADNTLVALTLMIAESRTEEKDIMVKVVVNLINQNNK
ncbi:MAG: virulence protein RhuM/Fic/DOC family protein [Muribaculaceae bacterium]|nr:virulence protein RhuM/Fic/DOC family protein [Muribaculaceae bacterium]